MGPRVPFAPPLLTLSLHITLNIYFISSRLLILLYVTCVMVNKAVKKIQILLVLVLNSARRETDWLYLGNKITIASIYGLQHFLKIEITSLIETTALLCVSYMWKKHNTKAFGLHGTVGRPFNGFLGYKILFLKFYGIHNTCGTNQRVCRTDFSMEKENCG